MCAAEREREGEGESTLQDNPRPSVLNLINAPDKKSEIGDPGGVKGFGNESENGRRGLEPSFNMLIDFQYHFSLPLYSMSYTGFGLFIS